MEALTICKGGKLTETKWVFDEETKEGGYKTIDITDSAISHLFDQCVLEEGVTLRDIFLLLNTELDIFDSILRNWTKEIVTEGLSQQELKEHKYNKDEIEYLDLYWHVSYDETIPAIYGYSMPDFHGMGWELQEDVPASYDSSIIEWEKGKRISWSLSFLSTKDLMHLPVKLNTNFDIYNDDTSSGHFHKKIQEFKGANFTLGNILYGIMWELSFHGGPGDRDAKGAELLAIADDIKNGTAELKDLLNEENK